MLNFNLEGEQIKTDLERWMYILCNMAKMEKIPVILRKRVFQKLFQIAEIANLKKDEYMLYEKALLDRWTEYAVKKTAAEKLKKAMKEGIEKGIEKGMEKGIEKGMERGIEQKSYEVVENLIIKFGFNDEQAANAAGIPVAVVKKIRTALKKKK